MKYTNTKTILASLLRETHTSISVAEAADILDISRHQAAKLLSSYVKKGWLTRITRGTYILVPLGSVGPTVPEDPLAIAAKLYAPCYIAGWSAAEHWGMTEQIFRSVIIMTQQHQHHYSPTIAGTQYLLHLAKPSKFFGLTSLWSNNAKILISDPSRTIVDLMLHPEIGGGIRSSADMFINYMKSSHKSIEKLVEYLGQAKVGAAYKRLGFLSEKFFPSEKILIEICKKSLTSGNAKLDGSMSCKNLITKWRLWVPDSWKENSID